MSEYRFSVSWRSNDDEVEDHNVDVASHAVDVASHAAAKAKARTLSKKYSYAVAEKFAPVLDSDGEEGWELSLEHVYVNGRLDFVNDLGS